MWNALRHTALAAAVLAGFGFAGFAVAQPVDPTAPDAVVEYGGPEPLTIVTANGEVTLSVEIAESPEARERGMMFRESLDPDAGMLFDFGETDFVAIWMANTLIPLDIIFIREDGRIAKIVTNAQPLSRRSMPSDIPVLSVLEINGGRSLELGIEPGDLVRHALFGTAEAEAAETPAEPQPEEG